jgi:hypothetical protein
VSAADNIGGGLDSPIFLPEGTRIADDDAELWSGNIQARLNADERGATGVFDGVWTGTSTNGTSNTYPLGGSRVVRASTNFTNFNWIESDDLSPSFSYRLYAISEELALPAAPAPVPPSIALLGLGLLGIAASRRRLRR